MGTDNMSMTRKFLNLITVRNELGRCLISEFYSTFIASVFVHGAIAQDVVARSGSVFNIAVTIGIGFNFALYSGFGVSGSHVNLAVSVGLAAIGLFPWKRIPVYFLAQLAGGYIGALIVYLVYLDAFNDFDGGMRQAFGENGTAGIFATFPQDYLTVTTGFFEQVLNTALFLAVIGALLDRRNNPPPLSLAPFLIGLLVFSIIMSFGHNSGSPLNPSIDLSGRLLLATVGYDSEVWTPEGVHWWWVPILGPTIGGAVGSWAYYLAITLHHPPLDNKEDATDCSENKNIDGIADNNTGEKNDLTKLVSTTRRRTSSDVDQDNIIMDEVSKPLSVDAQHHTSLKNESTSDIYL